MSPLLHAPPLQFDLYNPLLLHPDPLFVISQPKDPACLTYQLLDTNRRMVDDRE